MKVNLFLSFLVLILFQYCFNNSPSKKGSKSIDHLQWSSLLSKYVDDDGMVDYTGFQNDSIALNLYLKSLRTNPPDEQTWSKKEQIAYWINAYNAFTIKLILDHYPLKSIKDIGSVIQIPFVNSPWDIRFIEINGEKIDLNTIEHGILRKKFDEPRIHFAINCASFSCPKLRKEAYAADQLDRQLQEQAINFINDPQRNLIKTDEISVSKIFSWFKGDFTKNGSFIDFLNLYSKEPIEENASISYLDYNWLLNEKQEVKH